MRARRLLARQAVGIVINLSFFIILLHAWCTPALYAIFVTVVLEEESCVRFEKQECDTATDNFTLYADKHLFLEEFLVFAL